MRDVRGKAKAHVFFRAVWEHRGTGLGRGWTRGRRCADPCRGAARCSRGPPPEQCPRRALASDDSARPQEFVFLRAVLSFQRFLGRPMELTMRGA